MDIVALSHAVTSTLIPLLPYLLKVGENAAEEAGKRVAGEAWNSAKELWTKLRPKVEAKHAALEAANDAAVAPDDEIARDLLRLQLTKLLTEDEELAGEVSAWWEKAKAEGLTVTASGDRSVAIGGNVSNSPIITGDRNVVKS